MEVRERYIAQIMQEPEVFGLSEAAFIHAAQIFTSRATRLRCQYICNFARQSDLVPPFCPSTADSREILDEFKYGLFLRKSEPLGERDVSHVWRDFAAIVTDIENECFLRGYARTFAYGVGNCLHLHHNDSLRPCDYRDKRRPTLEAIGIDLAETFEMIQWEHHLTRRPAEPLQLFALLLLE